jgi:hypothetical protein
VGHGHPREAAGDDSGAPREGVFFLLFKLPAFSQFREQVAQRLRAAGRDRSLFDPLALSPVLIAADLDGSFSRWLPLRADPPSDCFAPVVVQ